MIARQLGSLAHEARAEVRIHLTRNPTYQRHRYPLHIRILRAGIHGRLVPGVLVAYLLIAATITALEDFNDAVCLQQSCAILLPPGLESNPNTDEILRDIAGFMIGAQTGLLGILSIAVALVTLIGQREHAGPDVRVYYYQSFAIPLATFSLALLAILCAQLFWPLEILSPYWGLGVSNSTSNFYITALHLLWLIGNILIYAHFTIVSLSFGQDHQRGRYRAQYTANVVVPSAISRAIIRAKWAASGPRLTLGVVNSSDLHIGPAYRRPSTPSAMINHRLPVKLTDVWMVPLKLAFRLWARRHGGNTDHVSTLYINVGFDQEYLGLHPCCLTADDRQLSNFEAFLVRLSFRFSRCR